MLTVRPRGISKWTGTLAYCTAYGIDATQVLAVGDGENDLELFASASISVAVDGGCEAAIATADFCIGPASGGGWGTW